MVLRGALVGSALLLAACAEAPLPVAAPPPRPARHVAKPVAKPRPTAAPVAEPIPAPPPPPALAVPEAPAEPLPPLTRSFATFTVRGTKHSIVGVAGRSADDLWFLTDASAYMGQIQGGVLHWNGKRVDRTVGPGCQGIFLTIQIEKDRVLLPGEDPGSGAWTGAHLPFKGGNWSCDHDFWGVAMGLPNGYFSPVGPAPGAAAWAFDCPSPFAGPCIFRSAGGRRAPFPVDIATASTGEEPRALRTRYWQIRGDDDGWMVLDGEPERPQLLRYNGVTWRVVSPLDDLDITGMWVDPEGHPWLTAEGALVRSDGVTTTRLPVTEAFAPTTITGTSARDVWFFGPGKQVHQWDGERLRRGEAPFEVGNAWAAPNGEVWITGRWDHENYAATTGAGVVARSAALPGVQR